MIKAGLKPNKPHKKDSAIPNLFPDKEELINQMERQHNADKEERLSRKSLNHAEKTADGGEVYEFAEELKN